MSRDKDRETRYFDFIHQYDARLNNIYHRWEAQIARQTAANKSQSLFSGVSQKKKHLFASMAIAVGSVAVLFQYNSAKASQNLIASNTQKLNAIAHDLGHLAAPQGKLICASNNNIYELSSGGVNNIALSNLSRAFIPYSNTLSLIRYNQTTQTPDAYLQLNLDRSLLFSSIAETEGTLTTESYVVDLSRSAELNRDSVRDRYKQAQIQSSAIDLQEELLGCLSNHQDLDLWQRYRYAD